MAGQNKPIYESFVIVNIIPYDKELEDRDVVLKYTKGRMRSQIVERIVEFIEGHKRSLTVHIDWDEVEDEDYKGLKLTLKARVWERRDVSTL